MHYFIAWAVNFARVVEYRLRDALIYGILSSGFQETISMGDKKKKKLSVGAS